MLPRRAELFDCLWHLPISYAALSVLLPGRIGTIYAIWHNNECSQPTITPLLPLVVLIIHSFSNRFKQLDLSDAPKSETQFIKQHAPIAIVCIAGLVALHSFAPLRSTYICAVTTPYHWTVPLTQRIAFALDVCTVFFLDRILKHGGPTLRIRRFTIGLILQVCSCFCMGSLTVRSLLLPSSSSASSTTLPRLKIDRGFLIFHYATFSMCS